MIGRPGLDLFRRAPDHDGFNAEGIPECRSHQEMASGPVPFAGRAFREVSTTMCPLPLGLASSPATSL